jgi:nucleoside-diphosphate kinase
MHDRAALGCDALHNAAHGSDSPESAARELGLFFRPGGRSVSASSCGGSGAGGASLALVKPHAMRQGLAGQLLEGIQVRGCRPLRNACHTQRQLYVEGGG